MTFAAKLPIALATFLALVAPAKSETLKIATVADLDPYNFLDDDGEMRGFEADLANELCLRAQITCEWVLVRWEDLIPSLNAGEVDAIMSYMQASEEFKTRIDFTEEYLSTRPSAILGLAGAGAPVAGSRIGVVFGTLQADWIVEQGYEAVYYNAADEGIYALRDGEVDGFFGDQRHLSRVENYHDATFDIVERDINAGENGLAIGVRLTDARTQEMFNQAIASVREDGTLRNLRRLWLRANYRSRAS